MLESFNTNSSEWKLQTALVLRRVKLYVSRRGVPKLPNGLSDCCLWMMLKFALKYVLHIMVEKRGFSGERRKRDNLSSRNCRTG